MIVPSRVIRVLFLHSSNEMYGADRMLLGVIGSMPENARATVWIPDDTQPAANPLSQHLDAAQVDFEIRKLAIVRRKYLNFTGLQTLVRNMFSVFIGLRSERPDVVFLTTSAALILAPVARLAGVKRVVFHNQEIWAGRERYALAFLAGFCHDAIAISQASFDSLLGPIVGRAFVITNGVPDRPDARTPAADHTGPIRFLVASRWNSWKGHETLLKAWDTSDSLGELVILGSAPPLGRSTDVPRLVSDLRHPESVTIVGETTDVIPFIDAADYVIVPSDSAEPFGLIAIEAYSRSRAVIGSDSGGLARIVEHGRTGFTFPPGDHAALASVLRDLATRGAADRMGTVARLAFEAEYSTNQFNLRFHEFWEHTMIATGERAR